MDRDSSLPPRSPALEGPCQPGHLRARSSSQHRATSWAPRPGQQGHPVGLQQCGPCIRVPKCLAGAAWGQACRELGARGLPAGVSSRTGATGPPSRAPAKPWPQGVAGLVTQSRDPHPVSGTLRNSPKQTRSPPCLTSRLKSPPRPPSARVTHRRPVAPGQGFIHHCVLSHILGVGPGSHL